MPGPGLSSACLLRPGPSTLPPAMGAVQSGDPEKKHQMPTAPQPEELRRHGNERDLVYAAGGDGPHDPRRGRVQGEGLGLPVSPSSAPGSVPTASHCRRQTGEDSELVGMRPWASARDLLSHWRLWTSSGFSGRNGDGRTVCHTHASRHHSG